MKPEQATAILALMEAQPDAWAKVCADSGAEDPEAFSTETIDALSEIASTEVEDGEGE